MDDFAGKPIYRARRRSGPLAGLGKVVFYVSSLAPAAFIVWHFDLVSQVDRRLKGEAAGTDRAETTPPAHAPAASPEPSASPTPPRRQPLRTKAPSARRGDDVARQSKVEGAAPASKPKQSLQPESAPAVAAVNDSPPRQVIAHTIDLDLGPRRQRYPIEEADATRFRIASLAGCDERYEMTPPDGRFDARSPATVHINGPRQVRLVVIVDARPRAAAIVVEPRVTTDAGDEIPLALANVERIRRRIMREGSAAADQLAAMADECDSLKTWIKAPIAKPLAAVGQAKARVGVIEAQMPRQAELVKTLEADLSVAAQVEEFANRLHQRGRLRIAKD